MGAPTPSPHVRIYNAPNTKPKSIMMQVICVEGDSGKGLERKDALAKPSRMGSWRPLPESPASQITGTRNPKTFENQTNC